MLVCNFRVQGRNPEKTAVLTDRNAHVVIGGQVISRHRRQVEISADGAITIPCGDEPHAVALPEQAQLRLFLGEVFPRIFDPCNPDASVTLAYENRVWSDYENEDY